MAKIQPGMYSVRELLAKANFDFEGQAAADYLDGAPDYRRVKVGGLGFDDLEKQIRVQPTADAVEISLDGKAVESLEVELNDEQQEVRRASFERAADVEVNE